MKNLPIFLILALAVVAAIVFIGYQSKNTPLLFLSVTSPGQQSTVSTSDITVQGKTVPNAEVLVNDNSGNADSNGVFAISTSLDEGDNTIVVIANDVDGNFTEQELTVIYNSGT